MAITDEPSLRLERTWSLDHRADTVPPARHALVEYLTENGVPRETVAEAELAAAELLSNAVTHGLPDSRGQVALTVRVRSRALEVAVTDCNTANEVRPAPPALLKTSGRGLRIVRSLAHEWGVSVDRNSGRRTVWAAIGGPSWRRVG